MTMQSASSMSTEVILAMLERVELISSASEVDAAYDRLAEYLTRKYHDLRPVLLPVLNGGLRLASEMMMRCDFPMELETLRVTRYQGIHGGQLNWHASTLLPLKGRHLVLLDDVLDQGYTLSGVQAELLSQDVETLCTLVLVEKNLVQPAVTQADLTGLKLPDRFLVGEGMDLAGYGRNLKGIWALHPKDGAEFS